MCERCKRSKGSPDDTTDTSPLEIITVAARWKVECSIRLARTALALGDDPERLLTLLGSCLPPGAAEFVFWAAFRTPRGPALPATTHVEAGATILRMNLSAEALRP